ncbi:MAG: S8 family serine peptidase [Betaproteobacteria bacterium]
MPRRNATARRKPERLRNLQFEGISIRPGDPVADARQAVAAVRKILKAEHLPWQVRPYGKRAKSVLVLPPPRSPQLSPAKAWELTYRLRARRDVMHAEPAFVLPSVGPYRAPARRGAAGGTAVDLRGSDDNDWALKLCHVFEAWNIPTPNGPQGKGSIVAHPDTGYTRHPELIRSDILFAKGYDFVANAPDALDPLDPPNAGHGTSTGSVILSDVGPAGATHVTGVAPQASLIPLRVSSSVVHFSWTRLCAALYRAIDERAHVVSMSLGGPWGGFALHEAIRDAIDAGLILVAAAGNGWPFVVYPARYDEVIAVAACNVDKQRWAGSASGSAVDITAPGESVWRARTTGAGTFKVDRSSGTSYAAAHVAGIGALWLAYHGRASLVAKYGVARIAAVFKEMLAADGHAGTPSPWPTHAMGAGIANAQSLLDARLPATAHAAGMAVRAGVLASAESDFDRIVSYFPRAEPQRVRAWLLAMFGVKERDLAPTLAAFADEIVFHLAADPKAYAATHAALAGRRGAVAVRPARLLRRASASLKRQIA